MRRTRFSKWSWLQAGSAAAGLILFATVWLFLTPDRWLGTRIPTHTAGTAFNLGLLTEIRVSLALLGLLCLTLGLFPRALFRLADHLAAPLAAVDQWLRKGKRWSVLLLACTAATAILFASYSIARHTALNSKAYDLGLHAQVFWNTSQGRLFASSIEVNNYLGDHVSPIILLLAPIYRLWPDPRGLLILQAVTLASGALPLALLTKRLVKPAWPDGAHLASLALGLIFLTYPALGFVNRFEFHEEVLVVPLLLLAFLCLETGRLRWMSVVLLLALLCKEDVGLTVAAFGLFVAWRQRDSRRIGFTWAAIGAAWSLVALLVIIPAFRGAPSDTLGRYAWLGTNSADVLQTLVREPGLAIQHTFGEPRRLWMLVKALLPTGFLALLSPAILVALPSLTINWLAGNLYQSSIYFHYAATLVPIVFASAAYGIAQVAGGRGQVAGEERTAESDGWVADIEAPPSTLRSSPVTCPLPPATCHVLLLLWLVSCAALALAFDQFWQPATGPADWENYSLPQMTDPTAFAAAAALLPATGSMATTEAFAPHLAERQGLFLLHDPRILQVADQVDWVLVDLNDHRYGVQPKQYYGLLRWIAERRGLETCFFAGDVVLLGPDCDNALAEQAYLTRLHDLQQAVVDAPIDASLAEMLGYRYFAP